MSSPEVAQFADEMRKARGVGDEFALLGADNHLYWPFQGKPPVRSVNFCKIIVRERDSQPGGPVWVSVEHHTTPALHWNNWNNIVNWNNGNSMKYLNKNHYKQYMYVLHHFLSYLTYIIHFIHKREIYLPIFSSEPILATSSSLTIPVLASSCGKYDSM